MTSCEFTVLLFKRNLIEHLNGDGLNLSKEAYGKLVDWACDEVKRAYIAGAHEMAFSASFAPVVVEPKQEGGQ